MPAPLVPEIRVVAGGRNDEEALKEIVGRVYDIEADDRSLRFLPDGTRPKDKGAHARHFDGLRIHYPIRREFRFTRVMLSHASDRLARKAAGLGFCVPA
jgi:hypothetical protein